MQAWKLSFASISGGFSVQVKLLEGNWVPRLLRSTQWEGTRYPLPEMIQHTYTEESGNE